MKNISRLGFIVALWGITAAVAGAFHVLKRLPPLGGLITIAAATVAFSIAVLREGWLRDALRSIGVRRIVAFHIGRFIGFSFIWLQMKGSLPAEFAERAGWGDVVTAAGALVLIFFPDGPAFRRMLVAWNVFGLLDLIVAVGTAAWLSATRPGSMIEITGLPLALIPLWLVPMLMASHFFLLRRGAGKTPFPVAGIPGTNLASPEV
jgi:hypothetical protein